MGKRAPLTEEEQRIRQATREAHETLQALNQAIRHARQLEQRLISEFETLAAREVKELGDQLQQQNNEAAARLNQDVAKAREYIVHLLTISSIKLDPERDVFTVEFPGGAFDDQVPPPDVRFSTGRNPQ